MADENNVPNTTDETKTQTKDLNAENSAEIKDLKEGLMEIATQLGRLRGELKTHKEEADAHNPGTIAKRKLN